MHMHTPDLTPLLPFLPTRFCHNYRLVGIATTHQTLSQLVKAVNNFMINIPGSKPFITSLLLHHPALYVNKQKLHQVIFYMS